MQYVYLISCENYYKIGSANDVLSRLASLQTGNPYLLRIESCYGFCNADVVERALHQKFSSRRTKGEWFSLTSDDLLDFERICLLLGGQSFEILNTSLEDGEEEDDEIITSEASELETIQIQGSDRRFPAIVRRSSYSIDKSRKTIQTISRQDQQGRNNPIYSAYADDIAAYYERRAAAGAGRFDTDQRNGHEKRN